MGASADRSALYRALCDLSPDQLDGVAAALEIPRAQQLPASAAPSHRATAILRWAERQPKGLQALSRAVEELLGGRKASAAEEGRPSALKRLGALPGQLLLAARSRGFERRWIAHILEEHGQLEAPGLGRGSVPAASFEDLYVPLHLTPSSAFVPADGGDAPMLALLGGRHPIADLLRLTTRATALAIVGGPGSGKSTLLRHLALTAVRGAGAEAGLGNARTPLFLHLPEHAAEIAGPAPILGLLAHTRLVQRAALGGSAPAGWFDHELSAGRALVLLDGFDELVVPEVRARVGAWIDREVERYPESRFLVAARPEGYRASPLRRAQVVEPLGFDAEQVRTYVRAWYEVTVGKDASGHRRKLPADAEHGLRELLQRIPSLPTARALAANPLFLSMLVMVHRHLGMIPGDRLGLYRATCDSMIDWLETEGAVAGMSLPQKRHVLQALSHGMMRRRSSDIPVDEALAILGPALISARAQGVAHQAFLEQMKSGSGLVRERAPGSWSFAHLGFQEYLCAARWLEHDEVKRSWIDPVSDAWWHGALRLYATEGDASAVVAACLDVNDVPALVLAEECLGEVQSLTGAARRAITERIEGEVESPDGARRRLAAQARLSRRLRSFHRLDPKIEIDLDYVTCAEFQLFLDEMGVLSRRYRPDHWLGGPFPPGAGKSPMLGVRPEDAEAFCAWLSRRRPGSRHRMPTGYEFRAQPASRTDVAAWCLHDGSEPTETHDSLGLAEEVEDQALHIVEKEARFGIAPPSVAMLRRELARDVAAGREEMLRNLPRMVAACARSVDEHSALSEHLGEGPIPAIRELRRAPPPDGTDRAALLAYLALMHRALGTDSNGLSADHYLALRRHVYLNYHLVLDVALALTLARDLPRFIDSAVTRRDFDPELDVTISLVRVLTCYGERTRELLERKQFAAASQEMAGQLTRSVPAQDPEMNRIGTLIATRIELADGPPSSRNAQRVFWRYGAQLAGYAFEFAQRRSQSAAATKKGLLASDLLPEKYREWADGPLVDIFWWAQRTIARSEGRIPAWEGLRLVREDS